MTTKLGGAQDKTAEKLARFQGAESPQPVNTNHKVETILDILGRVLGFLNKSCLSSESMRDNMAIRKPS